MGLFQSLCRPAKAHLLIESGDYRKIIHRNLEGKDDASSCASTSMCRPSRSMKHPDHRRYPDSRESTDNRASTRKRSESHFLAHLRSPERQSEPEIFAEASCRSLDKDDSPPVDFSPEVIGSSVEAVSKALPNSGVLLVENARFSVRKKPTPTASLSACKTG